MSTQSVGIIPRLHGEQIVAITRSRNFSATSEGGQPVDYRTSFQGAIDRNNILYRDDEKSYLLGKLKSFDAPGVETYPLLSQLLEKGAEIKVDGFDGSFEFEKPFYDPHTSLKTIASTAREAGEYPGIDESPFDLILSEKAYTGEVLSTNPYGEGEQIIVDSCEPSELNGEGWRTTVRLTNVNKEAFYNPSLLEAGITYYKINNVQGEYSTQFGGVDLPTGQPTGYVRARFTLGGIRGVEGFVTGFADAKSSGMSSASSKDKDAKIAMDAFRGQFGVSDPSFDFVLFGNVKDPRSLRSCHLMEYLVERTLMKRTATSHIWQKHGVVRTSENGLMYLNEGVWHQLRRGKIISVPRLKGITKQHILEAVNYIYRNNPMLRWEDRQVVFETGRLGEENLFDIFQNEVQQYFSMLQLRGQLTTFFGDRGLLSENLKNQLVGGNSLDALTINKLIRFVEVPLIGIAGSVSFKYNPALDHLGGQPLEQRSNLPYGTSWTSNTLLIWDITDPMYSNSTKNMNISANNENVKINQNLYIVRPAEAMLYKGTENGRWNFGKSEDIVSSSRLIGQSFWAFNSSAPWVPYPENVVMIELSPGARRSGYSGNMFP